MAVNVSQQLLEEVASRFERPEAIARRERNHRLIREGKYEEANESFRFALRRKRIVVNQMEQLAHGEVEVEEADIRPPPPEDLEERLFERIIGRNNLVDIGYFDGAVRAAKTVARIKVQGPSGSGFGTGSLVSPRLLLTNQHVLQTAEDARASQAEFNYQTGSVPVVFSLEPDTLYLSSPMRQLDYALVAVSPSSLDGTPAAEFGWNKAMEVQGKAIVGEYLNVIQHPGGLPKQVAHRDNLLIDIFEDFLHYESDTLQGSSGAPVFNDQWELVALHHLGVPKRKDGKLLKKNGEPADRTTPDSDIDWVANEGVRISRIVKSLEGMEAQTHEGKRLLQEMLDPSIRRPELAPPRPAPGPPSPPPPTPVGGGVIVTIPLTLTIQPGIPSAGAGPPVTRGGALQGFDGLPGAGPMPEEVTLKPSDYARRGGYDGAFLGDGESRAPLPGPGAWVQDLVPLADGSGSVLTYEHFSVLVSRSRRLPIVTGVNIDGRKLKDLPRKGDRWYYDPRIPKKYQVGNEMYRDNDLDRGHMVRRLDPVWGAKARVANEDTFHYTNACPQHKNLNQRTWNDLEEYVLGNAGAHDLKVCVFTGPVLRANDPAYRGVRLPREFWKVAVVRNADTGRLSATGYLLSQEEMIEGLEAFVYGRFRTYQVTLRHIATITGLDFGRLSGFDPLAESDGSPIESLAPSGRRPIRSPADLVFEA